MTVETPFRDFLAWWERAEALPADEQRRLWDELYAGRHPAVFGNYLHWFGDMGTLDDALPRYAGAAGKLERRFAALDLEAAGPAVADLFRVTEGFRVIAFVGVFTANAWMDELDGRPTVFFALEAEPETVWHPTAGVHELAHAAHFTLASAGWLDGVPGLAMMCEAIAIGATLRLVPDAAGERHFGVDDHAAWERACRAGWEHARRELLGCFEAHDERARRRFFWPDWGRDDHDVPERVGYYAAAHVIRALTERHELAEIARWSPEHALAEARGVLADPIAAGA